MSDGSKEHDDVVDVVHRLAITKNWRSKVERISIGEKVLTWRGIGGRVEAN